MPEIDTSPLEQQPNLIIHSYDTYRDVFNQINENLQESCPNYNEIQALFQKLYYDPGLDRTIPVPDTIRNLGFSDLDPIPIYTRRVGLHLLMQYLTNNNQEQSISTYAAFIDLANLRHADHINPFFAEDILRKAALAFLSLSKNDEKTHIDVVRAGGDEFMLIIRSTHPTCPLSEEEITQALSRQSGVYDTSYTFSPIQASSIEISKFTKKNFDNISGSVEQLIAILSGYIPNSESIRSIQQTANKKAEYSNQTIDKVLKTIYIDLADKHDSYFRDMTSMKEDDFRQRVDRFFKKHPYLSEYRFALQELTTMEQYLQPEIRPFLDMFIREKFAILEQTFRDPLLQDEVIPISEFIKHKDFMIDTYVARISLEGAIKSLNTILGYTYTDQIISLLWNKIKEIISSAGLDRANIICGRAGATFFLSLPNSIIQQHEKLFSALNSLDISEITHEISESAQIPSSLPITTTYDLVNSKSGDTLPNVLNRLDTVGKELFILYLDRLFTINPAQAWKLFLFYLFPKKRRQERTLRIRDTLEAFYPFSLEQHPFIKSLFDLFPEEDTNEQL